MKSILNILILTFTYSAFAGNGGGTMAATNGKVIPGGGSVGTVKTLENIRLGSKGGGGVLGRPQMVFNIGQRDGLVKYAHGQLQNGEWVVSEIVDSVDSVIQNLEFVRALTESQMKQDWVEIN